ncbi:MAG: hypothetical protein AAFR58_18445, partial [Cyanobacteria bacterium J06627_28]
MQSARKPHYLLLLCLTLVGSLTSAQSVMAQDVLPTLPDASVSSDAVAPTPPTGQPRSQAAPVPFRPPVQPTQTQP